MAGANSNGYEIASLRFLLHRAPRALRRAPRRRSDAVIIVSVPDQRLVVIDNGVLVGAVPGFHFQIRPRRSPAQLRDAARHARSGGESRRRCARWVRFSRASVSPGKSSGPIRLVAIRSSRASCICAAWRPATPALSTAESTFTARPRSGRSAAPPATVASACVRGMWCGFSTPCRSARRSRSSILPCASPRGMGRATADQPQSPPGGELTARRTRQKKSTFPARGRRKALTPRFFAGACRETTDFRLGRAWMSCQIRRSNFTEIYFGAAG